MLWLQSSTDLKSSLHSYLHWYHIGQYHHCQQSVGSENKIFRFSVILLKERTRIIMKYDETVSTNLWLLIPQLIVAIKYEA